MVDANQWRIEMARKLYNRIAVFRKEMGISRQQLGDLIGVNFQTVGYLEREEYNPSLDLALRISEVFDLPVESIFSTKPMKPLRKELAELKMRREINEKI